MIKKILLSVFVVIIAAVVATVYFLGPTMGAMLVGRPIFLGHDSPKRYGEAILTLAETQGIHADSQDFARAKVEVQAAIKPPKLGRSYTLLCERRCKLPAASTRISLHLRTTPRRRRRLLGMSSRASISTAISSP